MKLKHLKNFRQEAYQLLGTAKDAVMDLIDAVLVTRSVYSFAELSLSPVFRRKWPSLYEAIEDCQSQRRGLMKLYINEIPKDERIVLAGDHTAYPRLYAETLKDRTFEHGAKVISGKPITLGHGYSTIAWIPEISGSWALPLRHERITSHDSPLTKAAFQLRQACHHLPLRPLSLWDSEYGCAPFLKLTADIPADKIMRLRPNRCLWDVPKQQSKKGRPKKHGAKFKLCEPETWPTPIATEEIDDSKWGKIEIKHWTGLHYRESADIPMDIILIQRKGTNLSADAVKPIWLACLLEQMLPLSEFWPLYQRRFNIDHWNRFAKQRLHWTLPKLSTPEQGQSWSDLMPLLTWQLWLARDIVQDNPLPWQKPQQSGQLTPGRVAQSFAGILAYCKFFVDNRINCQNKETVMIRDCVSIPMKASFEVIVRDELGNVIAQLDPYQAELGNQTLYEIEGAVEDWKQQVLPNLESNLLSHAQSQFTKQGKKGTLRRNGTKTVQIKTLHGQFSFKLQKYQSSKQGKDYFDLTEQMKLGNISPRLEELVAYYSNRLSFAEVENLVTKWTGKRILCDQSIWNRSQAKAVQVSQQLEQEVKVVLSAFSNSVIEVNGQIDIYDPEQSEILLFEDGIQVKEQKRERESVKTREDHKEKEKKAKRRFILTDIAMLQLKNGQYEYIAAPIDESGQRLIDLSEVIKAKVISEYGLSIEPLNLLAITDGATSIRHHLQSIFGLSLVIILDWYHLSQKLRSLMSMIAQNKKEKSTHLAYLFPLLWKGKTDEAISYLQKEVKPRKEEQWRELIGYLTKHCAEIIDYSRRSLAGKPIGSGRMEKGVDLTVGRRQKKKGISWRPKGSRALSLLKVVELNGKWEQLWFPRHTA